jgi:hypothetical protein
VHLAALLVSAVISPLLANIYLHYALDQWVREWRGKFASGDVIIVRYADDSVLGFQHWKEAERFLEQLRKRLADYGLELHSEKTRRIQFGRFAAEDRKRDGAGKPETFNFLGFDQRRGRMVNLVQDKVSISSALVAGISAARSGKAASLRCIARRWASG